MKKSVAILFMMFCPMFLFGQNILWEKLHEYGGNETYTKIRVDIKDSTFIIVGVISDSGYYPNNFTKITINGDTLWHRKGKSTTGTGDQDLQRLDSSRFLISAMTADYSVFPAQFAVYLQELNSEGDTNTAIVYNYGNAVLPISLVNLIDKRKIISGYYSINSGSPTITAYFYYEIDSLNNLINQKFHGKSINTYHSYTFIDKFNNLIFNGGCDIVNPPYMKSYLVRTNTNGDSILAKSIQLHCNNCSELPERFLNNTIESLNETYTFTGQITDTNNQKMSFLANVDYNFNLNWVYKNSDIHFIKVKQLIDSSYIILGNLEYSYSPKIFLTRVSKAGQFLNTDTLISNSCSRLLLYDWDFLSDSSILVVGRCYDIPDKSYVARIGSVGLSAVIDTCKSYTVSFSAVQQNDTLWLTDNSVGGYSNAKTSQWNIDGTIYTGTTVGIPITGLPDSVNIALVSTNYYGCVDSLKRKEDVLNSVKSANYTQHIKLYPNPTTGKVNIQLPTTEPIEIILYTLQGQEIQRNTLNRSGQIDISPLSKGVYFYQVRTDSGTATGNIIKE